MFKVYKPQDERKSELFFALEEGGDSVSLVLVDEDGEKNYAGNILRINKDGLLLHSSVTKDAPFKRTSNGEIKVVS
jgi:hypothetical protein